MTKHTPAPWKYDTTGKYYQGKVIRMNGIVICRVSESAFSEETEANARLITAAPETKQQRDDLLEALQLLKNAFIHTDGNAKGNKAKTDIITLNPEVQDALNAAQSAIAKATS